jgi:hypothetical protein
MINPSPNLRVRRSSNTRPAWGMAGGKPRREYQEPVWTLTGRWRKVGRSSTQWECVGDGGAVEWIEAKRLEVVQCSES